MRGPLCPLTLVTYATKAHFLSFSNILDFLNRTATLLRSPTTLRSVLAEGRYACRYRYFHPWIQPLGHPHKGRNTVTIRDNSQRKLLIDHYNEA